MDGWYFSAESRIRDEDGRATGEPNVMARFEDHRHLNGPDLVPVLLSRCQMNLMGHSASGDISVRVLRFDLPTAEADKARALKQLKITQDDRKYAELSDIVRACDDAIKSVRQEAATALRRYPEAWKAYQKYRKTKPTDGERAVCAAIFGETEPEPKVKKPRAKKTAGNVVPLKAEVA
jgi:hypothetical protein